MIFTLFYYKILDLIWSVLHELIRFMAHDLGKNAGGQNVAVSWQRELSISNFPVSTILSGESPRKCAQEKIRIIPLIPPADESGYLPKPPTAKQFADCCNEFWWVSAYASKGLWREELPYARYILEVWIRDQLTRMLRWTIGAKTGFAVNPGKLGKHFQKYLNPELGEMLLKTYADGSYEHTWDALFAMGDLFRTAALRVEAHFGYRYNHTEDHNMTAHLRPPHVAAVRLSAA